MKFDIVVGNPPYQDENIGSNNQALPIYNYFYDFAERIAQEYILISPARFLSNQGATPKNWNKKMLTDKHIKIMYFNAKSNAVFLNVDIKGGVAILYRNQDKDFGAIETFIPFEKLQIVYDKVKETSNKNLDSLVYSPDSYRFTNELFIEHPELLGRTDKSHARAISSSVFTRYPEVFTEEIPDTEEDYIQIYGRLSNERIYRWIKRKYISSHSNLDKWKVILPGANGTGLFGEVISTPVLGNPKLGHNQTFVSLGAFDTKYEGESLLKYIKTKFARAMLGIMKTTQNNQSKNTWSKIPLQDFTKESDIDWSKAVSEIDQQLYVKYGLSQSEISFIEDTVKTME